MFILKCTSRPFEKQLHSSKTVENVNSKKGGNKFMEVNVRMAYGMRPIGAGYTPLKKLCCHMDMSEPMNSDNYDVSRSVKDDTQVAESM